MRCRTRPGCTHPTATRECLGTLIRVKQMHINRSMSEASAPHFADVLRRRLRLREVSKELRQWCDTEGLELDGAIEFTFTDDHSAASAHSMLRWLARRATQVHSAVLRFSEARVKPAKMISKRALCSAPGFALHKVFANAQDTFADNTAYIVNTVAQAMLDPGSYWNTSV